MLTYQSATDLMTTVVRLLRQNLDELVEAAREVLEPIEPWAIMGPDSPDISAYCAMLIYCDSLADKGSPHQNNTHPTCEAHCQGVR